MSTTSNETTVTWQSNRARDFKNRTESKLAARWEEITAHLAPPVVTWQWGESGLSQEMKCYLRNKGLIKRNPDGSKWRTSMDLWCYAIEKAANDEHVGAGASGQQLLLEEPVMSSRATRYLSDQTPASRGRARQATLTGDTADRNVGLDWDGVRENQMKDPTRKSDRELAAERPGQTRLSLATDYARDAWDVNVPWFRNPVRVPTGQVY